MEHAEQTGRLARLCRQIVRTGIRVEMSDAVPRLTVRSSAGTVVNVFVTESGEYAWRPVDQRCPEVETDKAAEALLAFIERLDRSAARVPEEPGDERR
ncbi:hypothetical protein GCM10027589_46520 [Actinocorallia lasiicapitis]